jgi:hypothetical protein
MNMSTTNNNESRNSPDNYGDNSLALIYKKMLGASINLREYYFLKRFNREPRANCIWVSARKSLATLINRYETQNSL